ncbi:MAG: arginine--tRNA ligase [Planctomycetaceae bacterium]|nr:arginine--tRNA ligase [Planctomycetaceae bacterium]
MNILDELRQRFAVVLKEVAPGGEKYVELVLPSQDARFGDYQANVAMPLGKQLGRPPREIAIELIARLVQTDLQTICEPLTEQAIAGPGFINLKLRNAWLAEQLQHALSDPRLGVAPASPAKTYIVDYSAPNVAKPMHVGHIRSTVIGNALYRILKFLGHRVIGDNHIGDWGTQFGMIIYGFKHFRDEAAYVRQPVAELARLYRLVSRLVDYRATQTESPKLEARLHAARQAAETARAQTPAEPAAAKKAAKEQQRLETRIKEAQGELDSARAKIAAVDQDPALANLVSAHPEIAAEVLAETARLHAGDAENLRLWREFMPYCLEDIERIYRRLGVEFDETLGESFYHDRLAPTVNDLQARGLARESEGALCVFLPGQSTPMIVRKQDGAFLYATTDLATIAYRKERWNPDAILYVVDHRQGLHFEQLFAAARAWGHQNVELVHVSFGTVLGDDGRPFKTRAGDTVGLEGLLDEAVRRALAVVAANDRSEAPPTGAESGGRDSHSTAETVGIAALKYADLAQNRTSDYVFSYDKMLAMNGNTATYMQYAYARVRSIFAKGEVDVDALLAKNPTITVDEPAERALGLEILRFSEALQLTVADYRPNQLTTYLFELANRFSTFFEECPVLKAPTPALRTSRLCLCELTARTLRQGLELLGIDVLERM